MDDTTSEGGDDRQSSLPRGIIALCQQAVHDRWLLAFDFDGTLAPFTSNPADSILAPAAMKHLGRLTVARTVAVISGRAAEDVRVRVPIDAVVIGNHGVEGLPGEHRTEHRARACVHDWLAILARIAGRSACWIEDKGLSISFHWRMAEDRPAAMAEAIRLVDALVPRPHLVPGELVLNCLPPGMPDKGNAVRRLLDQHGLGQALFVGDDWTDASVFTMQDPRITGIEVGAKNLGAFWRVPDQAAVETLLMIMSDALMPLPDPTEADESGSPFSRERPLHQSPPTNRPHSDMS
jgi:trehalose 6-phosphate phosphatase